MSSPAVIFGSLLLPSIWADPPFHWASEPVERLQTLRVLRMGVRPSHLIFRELRKAVIQLRRISLPRTWVNSALEELEDGLVDRGVPFDS
jgi:DNA-binding transcriptional ArsR family regulator